MSPISAHARAAWLDRFERARADLLDGRHVLAVRALLAQSPERPALLGDQAALGTARRVGVFAGSFNPQTVAHAAVAEAARTLARLDLLLWTLARVTVDKERVERATVEDRAVQLVAYCRAAAPGDAVLVLDAGLYADQAEAVRNAIGPESELWLVVGFDKVVQIFDPRYYVERDPALHSLFAAAGLLVAPRDGQGEADLAALLARAENHSFAASVRALPVPGTLAAVASTEARWQLADGAPLDGATAFDRLAGMLTPEGAALGAATGAYQSLEDGPDGQWADRYAARMRWLDTMAGDG